MLQYNEVKIQSQDIAVIPYSSGTTGLPKGVMISHQALVNNLCQYETFREVYDTKDHRTTLAPVPLFHIFGIVNFLLACPFFGSTSVLMPKFDLELFLKAIQEFKVTHISAVPPLLVALIKTPHGKYDLSSLQTITIGAAPLGADLQVSAKEKLKADVTQGYGMTELPTAVVLNPKNAIKVGSVGILLPNVEAKVISIFDGKELGPNEDGELWFRCPNMMTGYLHNPEATANTIDKEGFLHTGDVGHFDDEGYVFIVDRVKELIKYKGYQVAPAELEAIILAHPAVMDAAVVGRPDSVDGELPTAFVVLKNVQQASVTQLSEYVGNRVAPYKKLRGGVIFIDAIPRTQSGKILRKQLVAKLIKPNL